MTPLENILIALLWVGYGAFAAYQSRRTIWYDDAGLYVAYIYFAPLVFVAKCIYGAFKEYK